MTNASEQLLFKDLLTGMPRMEPFLQSSINITNDLGSIIKDGKMYQLVD